MKSNLAAVTSARTRSAAPSGPRRRAGSRIFWLSAVVLLAATATPFRAANALPPIATGAFFGNEVVTNECSKATDVDMAAYYQCLGARRDHERELLDATLDSALSTARASDVTQRFVPAIEHAERDWISWMSSECRLEGLIDGGSAAPTPWLERCELRLMKERIATIASLQSTLKALNAALGRRPGAIRRAQ